MSTPGKYVRAPPRESDSDTDESTYDDMAGGKYVRTLPTSSGGELVEEVVDSLAAYSTVASGDQLELQKRVKELEETVKQISECRNDKRTANTSSILVPVNRVDSAATSERITPHASSECSTEGTIRWDNITPFPKNVPATKMWEAWMCFIEDFEMASSLSNIRNPKRRVELLLLSMGEELKGIVRAAKLRPESQGDDCYNIFVNNIDRYLKSMTDPAAEHESFSNMRQEEGESAVNFHARLTRKVQLCGYSTEDQDRFVRTQLLRGIHNQELKKAARMYGHDSNFIVQSATRAEAFHAETAPPIAEPSVLAVGGSQSRGSLDRYKRRTYDQPRMEYPTKRFVSNRMTSSRGRVHVQASRRNRCGKCFRMFHRGVECPATRKHCNSCGMLGHFAVACRERRENVVKNGDFSCNATIEDTKEQVME